MHEGPIYGDYLSAPGVVVDRTDLDLWKSNNFIPSDHNLCSRSTLHRESPPASVEISPQFAEKFHLSFHTPNQVLKMSSCRTLIAYGVLKNASAIHYDDNKHLGEHHIPRRGSHLACATTPGQEMSR